MGFYGNITNVNKTQFNFDKTYPNRYTMDLNCASDSIFIGRYVLIEYDVAASLDSYAEVYLKEVSKGTKRYYAYSDSAYDASTIYIVGKNAIKGQTIVRQNAILYKCVDEDIIGHKAIFEEFAESNYAVNYQTDKNHYNADRGYDSTVWQKVFKDGSEKYVMIAELNTVVPTFGITAVAPTESPIVPHFGSDSTNVYYNLHLQPAWGFRVGEAEDPNKSDVTINVGTPDEKKAAIYYNAAGFEESSWVDEENYITIEPTGISGNKYSNHYGEEATAKPDIQELRIHLPAIGNMVSKGLDVIYGTKRDSGSGSLQGYLNHFNSIQSNSILIKNSNNEFKGASIQGDNWISTQLTNNIVSVSHKGNINAGNTVGSQILNFGQNFNISQLTYDEKGHITNVKNITYTMPSIQSVDSTSGKIITGVFSKDTSIQFNTSSLSDIKIDDTTTLGNKLSNIDNSINTNTDELKSLKDEVQNIIDNNNNMILDEVKYEVDFNEDSVSDVEYTIPDLIKLIHSSMVNDSTAEVITEGESTNIKITTNYALQSNQEIVTIRFKATSDYLKDQGLIINNESYELLTIGGTAPEDKAWVTNAIVSLNLDIVNKKAYLNGGGSSNSTVYPIFA